MPDAFCTECGEPLREEAKLCGSCGYTTGSLDGEAAPTPAPAPLPAGERTPNATSSNRFLLGWLALLIIGVCMGLLGQNYTFEPDCSGETVRVERKYTTTGSCKWSGIHVGEYRAVEWDEPPSPGGESLMRDEADAAETVGERFTAGGVVLAIGGVTAVVWGLSFSGTARRNDD